jgi:signal transduction histidine kinase
VYTASHDLKAPISNIEGLLHALLRTPPTESMHSEQVQQLLGMMQESVERFTTTIANLTDIVKLQKEANEETRQVQLAEVIEHVLLDLEALRAVAGARVEVEVAACPIIRFSAKNLRSVVYNLLSNALKYRAPERELRVQVQCGVTSEFYVLSVTDNGLGIESGHLDQLFTMFKRFHDHVEGSGIGLYMVKKIVENVGGKIEVESEIGVGSTFRVYFPR